MIPNASDTRVAIGDYASGVANRSLLFEKMPLPKSWGHPGGKFDEATRYNVLRASDHGPAFIRDSLGRNAEDHQSTIAKAMASVVINTNPTLRAQSTNHFLNLVSQSYPDRSRTFSAALGGRLLINMAGGVQENAGIALDRSFGLPLIPGSAVKGVARHAALWEIRTCEDVAKKQRILTIALLAFGFTADDLKEKANSTNWAWVAGNADVLAAALKPLPTQKDFKGLISFLPASPTDDTVSIVAEGITPHTDGDGKETKPNPLTFPAVERGSSFGFSIILNRQPPESILSFSILDQAATWIQSAVTGTGIGAKTSAGFGWFVIDEEAEARRQVAARQQVERVTKKAEEERLIAESAAKDAAERDNMTLVQRHCADITKLGDDDFFKKAKAATEGQIIGDELTAFFQVLATGEKKERRRQWRNKKAEFWAQLVAVAFAQGIELQ